MPILLTKAADPKRQLDGYINGTWKTLLPGLMGVYERQEEILSTDVLAEAIERDALPPTQVFSALAENWARWIREDLHPRLVDGMERASGSGLDRQDLPQPAYLEKADPPDPTQQAILAWLKGRERELLEYFTRQEARTLAAIIEEGVRNHQVAPGGVARDFKPLLSLSERDARSLMRRYAEEREQVGIRQARANLKERTAAKRLARSETAVQHELATAWNKGTLYGMQQRKAEGKVDPSVLKVVITAEDDRVCSICRPLERQGRELEEDFEHPDGMSFDAPPFHIKCRCGIAYKRRGDIAIPEGIDLFNFKSVGQQVMRGFADEAVDFLTGFLFVEIPMQVLKQSGRNQNRAALYAYIAGSPGKALTALKEDYKQGKGIAALAARDLGIGSPGRFKKLRTDVQEEFGHRLVRIQSEFGEDSPEYANLVRYLEDGGLDYEVALRAQKEGFDSVFLQQNELKILHPFWIERALVMEVEDAENARLWSTFEGMPEPGGIDPDEAAFLAWWTQESLAADRRKVDVGVLDEIQQHTANMVAGRIATEGWIDDKQLRAAIATLEKDVAKTGNKALAKRLKTFRVGLMMQEFGEKFAREYAALSGHAMSALTPEVIEFWHEGNKRRALSYLTQIAMKHWDASAHTTWSLALQMGARAATDIDVEISAPALAVGKANTLYNKHSALFQALARSIYINTQEDLRRSGINFVTLYRGVDGKGKDLTPWGKDVEFNTPILSRWTFDLATARQAAFRHETPGFYAVRVPRERVFSMGHTGIGNVRQGEVVLLGGDHRGWGVTGTSSPVFGDPPNSAESLKDLLRASGHLRPHEADGPMIAFAQPGGDFIPGGSTQRPSYMPPNLAAAERAMAPDRASRFEVGYVFKDPNDPPVEGWTSNKRYRIDMEFNSTNRELLKDGIFTHNHPADVSFGPDDVEAMTYVDLLEMRANGPNRRFVIRRPKDGWGDRAAIMQRYREIVGEEVTKRLPLLHNGELNKTEANYQATDAAMRRWAAEIGAEYTNEIRTDIEAAAYKRFFTEAQVEPYLTALAATDITDKDRQFYIEFIDDRKAFREYQRKLNRPGSYEMSERERRFDRVSHDLLIGAPEDIEVHTYLSEVYISSHADVGDVVELRGPIEARMMWQRGRAQVPEDAGGSVSVTIRIPKDAAMLPEGMVRRTAPLPDMFDEGAGLGLNDRVLLPPGMRYRVVEAMVDNDGMVEGRHFVLEIVYDDTRLRGSDEIVFRPLRGFGTPDIFDEQAPENFRVIDRQHYRLIDYDEPAMSGMPTTAVFATPDGLVGIQGKFHRGLSIGGGPRGEPEIFITAMGRFHTIRDVVDGRIVRAGGIAIGDESPLRLTQKGTLSVVAQFLEKLDPNGEAVRVKANRVTGARRGAKSAMTRKIPDWVRERAYIDDPSGLVISTREADALKRAYFDHFAAEPRDELFGSHYMILEPMGHSIMRAQRRAWELGTEAQEDARFRGVLTELAGIKLPLSGQFGIMPQVMDDIPQLYQHLADNWIGSSQNPTSLILQQAARDFIEEHFGRDIKYMPDVDRWDDEFGEFGFENWERLLPRYMYEGMGQEESWRAVVESIYWKTQQDLASKGIKFVTLYRGVKSRDELHHGPVDLTLAPLSSFTADARTAVSFLGDEPGYIVAMRVPVEDIWATPTTGFGHLGATETIVLGGGYQRAFAYKITKAMNDELWEGDPWNDPIMSFDKVEDLVGRMERTLDYWGLDAVPGGGVFGENPLARLRVRELGPRPMLLQHNPAGGGAPGRDARVYVYAPPADQEDNLVSYETEPEWTWGVHTEVVKHDDGTATLHATVQRFVWTNAARVDPDMAAEMFGVASDVDDWWLRNGLSAWVPEDLNAPISDVRPMAPGHARALMADLITRLQDEHKVTITRVVDATATRGTDVPVPDWIKRGHFTWLGEGGLGRFALADLFRRKQRVIDTATYRLARKELFTDEDLLEWGDEGRPPGVPDDVTWQFGSYLFETPAGRIAVTTEQRGDVLGIQEIGFLPESIDKLYERSGRTMHRDAFYANMRDIILTSDTRSDSPLGVRGLNSVLAQIVEDHPDAKMFVGSRGTGAHVETTGKRSASVEVRIPEWMRTGDWVEPDDTPTGFGMDIIMGGDKDDLLPELRDYYHETGSFPVLQHPLVYQVPFYSAQMANEQYKQKARAVAESIQKKAWTRALMFIERPWRLPSLHEWWMQGDVSVEDLRELLPFVWTDTESPHQFDNMPIELFKAAGFVTDAEADDLQLPTGTIKIYRGADAGFEPGMAWSTSRDVAAWFAHRFADDPIVYEAEVDSEHVLGWFIGRGEMEVVVDPDRVRNLVERDPGPRPSGRPGSFSMSDLFHTNADDFRNTDDRPGFAFSQEDLFDVEFDTLSPDEARLFDKQMVEQPELKVTPLIDMFDGERLEGPITPPNNTEGTKYITQINLSARLEQELQWSEEVLEEVFKAFDNTSELSDVLRAVYQGARHGLWEIMEDREEGIHVPLEVVRAAHQRAYAALVRSVQESWAASPQRSVPSLALQQIINTKWALKKAWMPQDATSDKVTRHLYANSYVHDFYHKLAEQVFRATQEDLAEQGVEYVTLYRGAIMSKWSKRLETETAFKDGVQSAPISSWTPDLDTAMDFAVDMGDLEHKEGAVIQAVRVPRHQVWGTARTGLGSPPEREVLVLGGHHPVVVINAEDISDAIMGEFRAGFTDTDRDAFFDNWLREEFGRLGLRTEPSKGFFSMPNLFEDLPGDPPRRLRVPDAIETGTTQELNTATTVDLGKTLLRRLGEYVSRTEDPEYFDDVSIRIREKVKAEISQKLGVRIREHVNWFQVMDLVDDLAAHADQVREGAPGGYQTWRQYSVALHTALEGTDDLEDADRALSTLGDNIAEALASQMLGTWAATSSKAPYSVALQLAVRDVFGAGKLEHFDDRLSDSMVKGHRWYGRHKHIFNTFVREMYEETQDHLESEGVDDYVTLYRGMGASNTDFPDNWDDNTIRDRLAVGTEAFINLQPISSFSTDVNTAEAFHGSGQFSVLMGVRVPRSRIIATSRTGVGALHEAEVVVLGGQYRAFLQQNVGNKAFRIIEQASAAGALVGRTLEPHERTIGDVPLLPRERARIGQWLLLDVATSGNTFPKWFKPNYGFADVPEALERVKPARGREWETIAAYFNWALPEYDRKKAEQHNWPNPGQYDVGPYIEWPEEMGSVVYGPGGLENFTGGDAVDSDLWDFRTGFESTLDNARKAMALMAQQGYTKVTAYRVIPDWEGLPEMDLGGAQYVDKRYAAFWFDSEKAATEYAQKHGWSGTLVSAEIPWDHLAMRLPNRPEEAKQWYQATGDIRWSGIMEQNSGFWIARQRGLLVTQVDRVEVKPYEPPTTLDLLRDLLGDPPEVGDLDDNSDLARRVQGYVARAAYEAGATYLIKTRGAGWGESRIMNELKARAAAKAFGLQDLLNKGWATQTPKGLGLLMELEEAETIVDYMNMLPAHAHIQSELNSDNLLSLAIFERLINADDRHEFNFLVQKHYATGKATLIGLDYEHAFLTGYSDLFPHGFNDNDIPFVDEFQVYPRLIDNVFLRVEQEALQTLEPLLTEEQFIELDLRFAALHNVRQRWASLWPHQGNLPTWRAFTDAWNNELQALRKTRGAIEDRAVRIPKPTLGAPSQGGGMLDFHDGLELHYTTKGHYKYEVVDPNTSKVVGYIAVNPGGPGVPEEFWAYDHLGKNIADYITWTEAVSAIKATVYDTKGLSLFGYVGTDFNYTVVDANNDIVGYIKVLHENDKFKFSAYDADKDPVGLQLDGMPQAMALLKPKLSDHLLPDPDALGGFGKEVAGMQLLNSTFPDYDYVVKDPANPGAPIGWVEVDGAGGVWYAYDADHKPLDSSSSLEDAVVKVKDAFSFATELPPLNIPKLNAYLLHEAVDLMDPVETEGEGKFGVAIASSGEIVGEVYQIPANGKWTGLYYELVPNETNTGVVQTSTVHTLAGAHDTPEEAAEAVKLAYIHQEEQSPPLPPVTGDPVADLLTKVGVKHGVQIEWDQESDMFTVTTPDGKDFDIERDAPHKYTVFDGNVGEWMEFTTLDLAVQYGVMYLI